MLNKFFANNKLLILFDQGLYSALSFFITILLARILSPDDFGEYSGFVLVSFLCISLLNALIIQPFQVSFAKELNKDQYISFLTLSQFIFTLFIVLIAYLIWTLKPFFELSGFSLLFLIGFSTNDYIRKLLLVLDKAKEILIFDFVYCIILSGLFVYIFYTLNQIDLTLIYSVLIIAYFPSILYSCSFIKFSIFDFSVSKRFLVSHLTQGKWLLMTNGVQWWSSNMFVVASGLYLGKNALGALRLSQTLFGVLNVILQTFENYVLPQASKIYATNKDSSVKYLSKMTKYASIIFLPFMTIVFIFSNEIMLKIGGVKYQEYAFLLKGMTLLYVLIYICQPIRICIRMMLLNNYFFYAYLCSLGFSFITSNYLLTHYRLNGALMGLIGSQLILMLFWSYILYKKEFKVWKLFI